MSEKFVPKKTVSEDRAGNVTEHVEMVLEKKTREKPYSPEGKEKDE